MKAPIDTVNFVITKAGVPFNVTFTPGIPIGVRNVGGFTYVDMTPIPGTQPESCPFTFVVPGVEYPGLNVAKLGGRLPGTVGGGYLYGSCFSTPPSPTQNPNS